MERNNFMAQNPYRFADGQDMVSLRDTILKPTVKSSRENIYRSKRGIALRKFFFLVVTYAIYFVAMFGIAKIVTPLPLWAKDLSVFVFPFIYWLAAIGLWYSMRPKYIGKHEKSVVSNKKVLSEARARIQLINKEINRRELREMGIYV